MISFHDSLKMAYGFPSPTGDLYFSIVPVLTSHAGLNPFPSPTGDLYFSIFIGVVTIVGTSFRPLPGTYISQYFYLAANRGVFSVSVPYRGLIFLNKLFIVSRLLIMVSVPYRGLIFLNRI